jgi:dethiobiotin synthetase
MNSFFITGTDTEVGKTHVTCLLLKFLTQHQRSAIGFKPIAAGAEEAFGQLVNEDALNIMESSNVHAKYKQINPICFEPPIAPHIAAQRVNKVITQIELNHHYKEILSVGAEFTLVEGAGGWSLPINDTEYLSDWVKAREIPVILVVGMKLGCLNHTLLTIQALKAQGVKCAGWVANEIDPNMSEFDANLESLKQRIDVPLLAISPFSKGKAKLKIYKALTDLFSVSL